MLIGIVSDTHGHVEFTREAVRMLESMDVELVIHCGDIGSPRIPQMFEQWPTHFVLGNVDYDAAQLKNVIESIPGHQFHGLAGTLEIESKRIGFTHSHDARQFHHMCHSGEWDVVCYGHTHIAKQETIGQTLVLNPGAVYRASPHSIAVMSLPELEVYPTIL